MMIIGSDNCKAELPISVLNQDVFDLYIQIVDAEKKDKAFFEDIPLDYFVSRDVDFQVVNNEIRASAAQCQLLWNCSYALAISEDYYRDGRIDNDVFIQRAFDLLVFNYSAFLENPNLAYILPNPAVYSSLESKYVRKANLYYKSALRFILYHEFEHVNQSKFQNQQENSDYEIRADIYAVKRLCKDYKANSVPVEGVEASMLYFLLIEKGNINGDSAHGNAMDRIQIIAEQFDNMDLFSCIKWQVVIAIWNKLNNYGFVIPTDSSLKSLKNVIYLIKRKFINN